MVCGLDGADGHAQHRSDLAAGHAEGSLISDRAPRLGQVRRGLLDPLSLACDDGGFFWRSVHRDIVL